MTSVEFLTVNSRDWKNVRWIPYWGVITDFLQEVESPFNWQEIEAKWSVYTLKQFQGEDTRYWLPNYIGINMEWCFVWLR